MRPALSASLAAKNASAVAALSLRGIQKRFGAVQVLCGIDLDILPGEVHALIGPNGAGKSTLFDIVSGRTRADGGTVHLASHGDAGASSAAGSIDVSNLPPHRLAL